MKALKRLNDQKKDIRHEARVTNQVIRRISLRLAVKSVSLAFAIVLHRKHGFGKLRFEDVFKDVIELIDYTVDRYDPDSAITALEHQAEEELGIKIEI